MPSMAPLEDDEEEFVGINPMPLLEGNKKIKEGKVFKVLTILQYC